jgi:RNA polymerase sigma-70 factor, ECF subfamily
MRSATRTTPGGAGGTVERFDDPELLRRIRAGDRSAFTGLVRRHCGALLRLARVFVHEAFVEEVVQDTWVAVLDGLDGFEGRASFKTWLYRILANRARTRATREARTVPFSALAATDDDAPALDPERFDEGGTWRDPPVGWSEETPERLALAAETRAVMEAAVAALPPGQRAVLVLRDEDGLETEEICNLLGLTATNQRVLLHRARTRVRQAIETHMRGRG